ncbi:MAG: sulfatase-like hydrolase/transferase [Acidobacteria bacterium]|nr:sulfatase-like hydrolase/transferase [Acidobacteriota bacterium]MCI0626191.1 sulfatase-like hydrolase/transferase [Acidobacteriota bacterium]MCI0717867.1 sulfatase-like hydrolase/transferase [Acidobacteriota bacterium]
MLAKVLALLVLSTCLSPNSATGQGRATEFLNTGFGLALGNKLGIFSPKSHNSATRSDKGPRKKPGIIIIFADDYGYADLGSQGVLSDLKTPRMDRLAAEGVRFTDGYVTAPQCSPSRAGLLTGRYQQRFGLDENSDVPLPLEEKTIAARLQAAGYVTGMVGKWHLEPHMGARKWASTHLEKVETRPDGYVNIPFEAQLPYYPQHRGFNEFFKGELRRFWASYRLDGSDLNPKGNWIEDSQYHLDVHSDAAVAFIERNKENPFFLYLAYIAPHMPLIATEKYLKRFPGDMPERRRYALAMISAMDDGVGRILDVLKKYGLEEDTLVFFLSDNGAPLKLTKVDNPIGTDLGGWNGSVNDPLVGEKGMLSEGGIRIPFIARWKGVLPAGLIYSEPVISMDIAATAVELAGLPKPEELDGVNLIPYLTKERAGSPHEALYWRFLSQTAIRKGKWKYLQAGGKARYLFDLTNAKHEKLNRIEQHPDIALELQKDLAKWAATLKRPGIPGGHLEHSQEKGWYGHHLGLPE